MARIRVIHEDEATGELAEYYGEAREQGRRVANVRKVVSLNPKAMKALDAFRNSWYEHGVLSARHREMLAMVTSVINRCYYWTAKHGEFLRRALDSDTAATFVAEVGEDWRSADLSSKEQAMLEFAENVSLTASTMTSDGVERLRRVGWNDREILDITLIVCYYNFMCRLADSLGVDLDEGEVDTGLLQELERRRVTPVHP